MKCIITVLSVMFAGGLLGPGRGYGQTVAFEIQTTDATGLPITQVSIGDAFWLNVSAQDRRPEPLGILSAYLDVDYDPSHVRVLPNTLEHGTSFGELTRGDVRTPPVLDEIGSFARGYLAIPPLPERLDGGAHQLFRIEFLAEQLGEATFTGNPADVFPRHATTVHGLNVAVTDFAFTNASIRIVPEPQSLLLAITAMLAMALGLTRQRR
jgi:hypothetical protein